MLEKRDKTVSRKWGVAPLGGRVALGVIPIRADIFSEVRRSCEAKGYVPRHTEGKCKRYERPAIKGLYFELNETDKSITAVALSESALYQIVNDFNLPLYKKD